MRPAAGAAPVRPPFVTRVRRGSTLGLGVMVFGALTLGPGSLVALALHDALTKPPGEGAFGASVGEALAAVAAWLMAMGLAAMYVVFDERRFAFHDDELQVLTWRGRRILPWAEVTQARLVKPLRSGMLLELRGAGGSRINVPIAAYAASAALLEAIRARLTVAVQASPRQLEALD